MIYAIPILLTISFLYGKYSARHASINSSPPVISVNFNYLQKKACVFCKINILRAGILE